MNITAESVKDVADNLDTDLERLGSLPLDDIAKQAASVAVSQEELNKCERLMREKGLL